MNNFAKLTLAAVTAVLVGTTLAQASAVKSIRTKGIIHKVAACTVAGTPSEFPNDIWIMNKGLVKLIAGTKVNWGIDGYSAYKGTHTLVADLSPGQGVHLNNVLPGGVEAGRPCSAKAL